MCLAGVVSLGWASDGGAPGDDKRYIAVAFKADGGLLLVSKSVYTVGPRDRLAGKDNSQAHFLVPRLW